MTIEALFGLSILMSFLACGIVTRLYIWPRLRVIAREDALLPLVVPHMFRFVGLSFLVPGVVSPTLPSAFAVPAAYGDLVAAILAVIATLALSARTSWAIAIVWVFNVWALPISCMRSTTARSVFASARGRWALRSIFRPSSCHRFSSPMG